MSQSEWKNISYNDKDILVALPVKVGVWISHYDDQGDVNANDNETSALKEIISYLADDKTSTLFVTDLFKETLHAQESWTSWPCDHNCVIQDAKKAISIIKSNVSKQDVDAFREALLTVCEVVAQAYGEFGSYDETQDGVSWLDHIKTTLQKLKGQSYVSMDRPFNVSPAEQEAIYELRAALSS